MGDVVKQFRLDSVAPSVADRFRRATPERRREAAHVACERAVVAARLTLPDVGEALAVIRGAPLVDPTLRERLESRVEQFDDAYFQLGESGGPHGEALGWFRKARATSALAHALVADDRELHEAIYEALNALDESAELLRVVEGILG